LTGMTNRASDHCPVCPSGKCTSNLIDTCGSTPAAACRDAQRESEREIERESESESERASACVCVCVRERERERERESLHKTNFTNFPSIHKYFP